jgi:hypothetical protein
MPVGQHARSGGDASQQTSPPTRSGNASCCTACDGPRDGLDVRRPAHPTLHWRFSYPQTATPAHLGSLQRGNVTQSRQCYRALPRQSGHSAGRAPPGHHRGQRPVQESSPLGNSDPQSSRLANPPQAARAAWRARSQFWSQLPSYVVIRERLSDRFTSVDGECRPAWTWVCGFGKRVGFTPSRVRIPHPPLSAPSPCNPDR